MEKTRWGCPVDDFLCPYYDRNFGECALENPEENCDAWYENEEEEEEDE